VVAHWHKLFGNVQTSVQDFYTSVELALDARKIPGLKISRVKWSEGGVLSPNREYLRVEGDRHSFDMCAAPFGTGFFFSSWVTRRKARLVGIYLIGFVLLTFGIRWVLQRGLGSIWRSSGGAEQGYLFQVLRLGSSPFVLLPVALLIVLWLIAMAARLGETDPEAAIRTVPLIGWFYEQVFAPETYYRIDTRNMFQSAVHSAMMEAIDGLMTQKGLRALSESDRKPVSRELAGGVDSSFATMSGGGHPLVAPTSDS
jgi:hypothetical protein